MRRSIGQQLCGRERRHVPIVCLQVDNVINRMGLRGVADSRVGGAVVRGVSGGEKRRVTIALQLLKDPGNYVLISSFPLYRCVLYVFVYFTDPSGIYPIQNSVRFS